MSLLPDHAFDRLVIAIDGPSGSGKSSTSRGVAQRLGLRYLDTGAMFRAMTWWLLREGVDVHDPAAVAARVEEPEILSGTDPTGPSILVDGVDVGLAIRSDDGDRGGLAGQHRSRGPGAPARAPARDHRRGRHRGRGARHRLGGRPRRRRQGLPHRRRRRPGRAPGRRGGRRRPGRYPRVAAGPRQDRLGPRHRTADPGRGRRRDRRDGVHARRGDRPGGRAARRSPSSRSRSPDPIPSSVSKAT